MCENPPSHTLPSSRAMRALVLASLALCAPPHFQSCSKAYGPLYSVHTAHKEGRSYNARIHFKTPASKTVISINHD